MKKLTSTLLVIATLVAAGTLGLSTAAHAQTVASATPVFYQQNGTVVNPNGTSVPAGYYYIAPGGDQVYYYGHGTYYDATTQMYGGHVFGSYVYPVTTATGQTPVFYNQAGQAVNPAGTSVPAGNYYLANGNQVEYYGNGTYYNPTTQTYGGMIFGGPVTTVSAPGIPNTGMGGQATMNWFVLAATALIFAGATVYIYRRGTVLS